MQARTRSRWLVWFILFSVTLIGIAGEDDATEKAMSLLMEKKEAGFVNVRGERRGFVQNKGELRSRIKLYGGQEYLAIIAGDKDVEKLQLVIKDPKGNVVQQSDVDKNFVSMTFTPPSKDKYSFYFLTPGKGGYYHFSLATK